MGANNSQENKPSITESYQLLSTEDDPRFGEIQIYRDTQNSEIYWIKEINMEDEKSLKFYEGYIQNLMEHRRKTGKNTEFIGGEAEDFFITKNVEIFGGNSGGLCGACNMGKGLRVIMEFYERDLEGEVMRRAEDLVRIYLFFLLTNFGQDYFPEAEIWYILEAIMTVEKYMLQKMRVHGDIRTSAIFISEEGIFSLKLPLNSNILLGVAKFIDTNLTGYKKNAYIKTMLGMSKCPLAPEQLSSLSKKESNPKHESQSTESWSIGIVLLTMATLSSDEVIYNWRDKSIDKRGYAHLMNQVHQRYSPLFNELVKKCLDFDPHNRPKLSDILGYLGRRKSEK